MADKPSRALVVYGDGLAPSVEASHAHLHSLASKACCGFLSLPNSPPSESEDDRIVREFAVLLDAFDAYVRKGKESDCDTGSQGTASIPTVSERFMGMKAAIVTSNPSSRSFGNKLGISVFQFEQLIDKKHSVADGPIDAVSYGLLKLLGFQEGKLMDTGYFDIVFVHIGAGEPVDGEADEDVNYGIEYVNALVGSLMHVAQPRSEISSRLHLSVVMSYGDISKFDCSHLSTLVSKDNVDSRLLRLFPRQSYTMRGEKPREDVRHHCPMLIAQWQDAVTRRDAAETFSFEDFKEHGGNLVIPADRFLHEIAFKLWKAPKYGA
ncbi:hypothetical protein EUGRSUZ_C03044 [Eucalyptus grandis]|uniref:AT5G11810-like protein n=4 Tax=Eucalyptus grandis TaxID=71139 RepID=A0A059CU16_EUCGR|nr:hypothetical protein EUGRSUZ_C03044 [Eucalyptus grandis]